MFNNRCMDMGDYMHKDYGKNMDYMQKDYEYKEKEYMHKDYKMEMPVGSGVPYMAYGVHSLPGIVCPPVYECPEVSYCHREIVHMVPHIKPLETKIINHHVYKHTYSPHYSCCEENVCENVYEMPNCGY